MLMILAALSNEESVNCARRTMTLISRDLRSIVHLNVSVGDERRQLRAAQWRTDRKLMIERIKTSEKRQQ